MISHKQITRLSPSLFCFLCVIFYHSNTISLFLWSCHQRIFFFDSPSVSRPYLLYMFLFKLNCTYLNNFFFTYILLSITSFILIFCFFNAILALVFFFWVPSSLVDSSDSHYIGLQIVYLSEPYNLLFSFWYFLRYPNYITSSS